MIKHYQHAIGVAGMGSAHARGLGRLGFVFSGSLFHRIRHTPA
ncbi:MAG: hypothetical protein ACFNX9_01100 [Eikenella corrodens]